ncbi:uncharacterized protein [Rhodnius prolixus]|uniref:Protein panstrongylus lignarius n=1 Tax=Rhodnius prolixus TaxID=13249 RepID=A0A4P6DFZ6_RHOPR
MSGQHDICSIPMGKPVPTTLKDMSKCDLFHGKELKHEPQSHSCMQPKQDPCAPAHNEYICHMMGERRQHYLNEVKKILDRMDTMECPQKSDVEAIAGCGGQILGEKPMLKYPGYLDKDSPKFRRPFYAPLISSVPVKELRPTDQLSKHKGESSEILEYVDVEDPSVKPCNPWALPRQKSFELKNSIMLKGCDCHKHNGLQDNCERSECRGSPECLTQPLPTCGPSYSQVAPPHQRPVNDMVREAVNARVASTNKTYCCCSSKGEPKYKNIGGKQYPDCNHAGGPGSFVCYKCKQ